MPRFHLPISFEANDQEAAQRVADQIRSFLDEGDFAPEHRDAKVDEPTTGQRPEEIVERVRALVNNQRPAMVAAWLVGQRDGEDRLTSVSVIRYRDVVEAIGED